MKNNANNSFSFSFFFFCICSLLLRDMVINSKLHFHVFCALICIWGERERRRMQSWKIKFEFLQSSEDIVTKTRELKGVREPINKVFCRIYLFLSIYLLFSFHSQSNSTYFLFFYLFAEHFFAFSPNPRIKMVGHEEPKPKIGNKENE